MTTYWQGEVDCGGEDIKICEGHHDTPQAAYAEACDLAADGQMPMACEWDTDGNNTGRYYPGGQVAEAAGLAASDGVVTVKVDDENNADVFWANLDAELPELADRLRRGEATVDAETWAKLQAIDGFRDGPDHAPTALQMTNNESKE